MEGDVQNFESEKTLMETFLSQASCSDVSSSDLTFMQRNLNDSGHYENEHFLTNSYSHGSNISNVGKHFQCDVVDGSYVRESGNYFSSFDSDREEHQNEPSQSFTAQTDFDISESQALGGAQYANHKISHPSLRIELGEDVPQLNYEGGVGEESESCYPSNSSGSRSSLEARIDSACPLLMQESSYAMVNRSLNDDRDRSCPLLIQETPYFQVESSQAIGRHPRPCISKGIRKWDGENPLRRFSVLVGNKKLNFRVCDRSSSSYNSTNGLDSEAYASNDSIIFKGNKCFVCGRTFPTKPRLREHQMSHTGAKPIPCAFCGRIFYNKTSLQIHERIHTGEKPFQCPICTKCFARQTNYNIHMKLHASGRRYFCSFCGKWFRAEAEMLDHQQQCLARMQGVAINTERPLRYQCSFCEKMFHHRRDKNIHERTHTGERPYSCGYCGKGFTQSQALTIHIRTHTGERPYSCAICSKDFRDSSALRKHEFIKHTTLRIPTSTYSTLNDVVLMSVPSLLSPERLRISD